MTDHVQALRAEREQAYRRTQRAFSDLTLADEELQDARERMREANDDREQEAYYLRQREIAEEKREGANKAFLEAARDYMNSTDELRMLGLA